ncbi:hypothetical protein [Kitasatospora sp. NPDC059571]|uniref:hypothetical protein n=1 Tax=Kitasatospora sp. NPDC059571 TaxID=3346871 RepID=UPI00367A837C
MDRGGDAPRPPGIPAALPGERLTEAVITPDEVKALERSAEQRNITAPTPKDVRAKAQDDEDVPAADTQAP